MQKLGWRTGCAAGWAMLGIAGAMAQAPSGQCYAYDAAGRLIQVADTATSSTRNFTLDAASNRVAVTSAAATNCVANLPPPPGGSASSGSGAGPPPSLTGGGANRAPTPLSDAATVPKLNTVSVLVLDNDTDPDGDPLEVTSATYNAAQVQVTRIRLPGQTRYSYLDVVGIQLGNATITYTVSDGRGGVATSTVSILVSDGPPPDLGWID